MYVPDQLIEPENIKIEIHISPNAKARRGSPKLDWPSKICINRPKQKRDNPVKLKSITSEFPGMF
jgi:hypothetical protein